MNKSNWGVIDLGELYEASTDGCGNCCALELCNVYEYAVSRPALIVSKAPPNLDAIAEHKAFIVDGIKNPKTGAEIFLTYHYNPEWRKGNRVIGGERIPKYRLKEEVDICPESDFDVFDFVFADTESFAFNWHKAYEYFQKGVVYVFIGAPQDYSMTFINNLADAYPETLLYESPPFQNLNYDKDRAALKLMAFYKK